MWISAPFSSLMLCHLLQSIENFSFILMLLFSAEEVQRFKKKLSSLCFVMCFETHELPIFSCYRLFPGCCHFVSWMWTLQHCIINWLGILTTLLWHIHQFLQYPQFISFCLFFTPCMCVLVFTLVLLHLSGCLV